MIWMWFVVMNERVDFFSASLHKRLVQTEIQNEDLRRLLMLTYISF